MNKLASINKALYESRIARNESLLDASKALGIFKLHLSLIEKGYLKVNKKLEPKFIKHYHLNADFFTSHSSYVEPIDIMPKKEKNNFTKVLINKKTKIIELVVALFALATLIAGICINSNIYANPRAAWSNNYTELRNAVIDEAEEVTIDPMLMDVKYFVTTNIENSTHEIRMTTNVYLKEINASDTNLEIRFKPIDDIHPYIGFNLSCYNRRIITFVTYYMNFSSPAISEYATCFIENDHTFNLRPFSYQTELFELRHADYKDPFYQEVNNAINLYLPQAFTLYKEKVIDPLNLSYESTYALLSDVRNISRHYVFNFRLSFYFKLFSTIILVLSLALFILSIALNYKIKPKLDINPKTNDDIKYKIADITLPTRSGPKDINVPLLIPECALRIAGLIIILLFAVGLNLSLYWKLNIDIFTTNNRIEQLRNISNNLLVAGTSLLFFLKLDIYYKKSQKELLINIALLFIAGLIYYLVEIILYNTFLREFDNSTNVFSMLILLLTNFMPGNIIWNLMLYSLIFLFLFVTPKRIEEYPHKILKYRLCSLIPTTFLLFVFFYKVFIEPTSPAPYPIACIFFTKGILITMFAIAYLYALYFLRLYYRFKFGEAVSKEYYNSRAFAFTKNLDAAIIITILFLIDIFFKYKVPYNVLNLGHNWSIILLVPLILLYHPHIGKRNIKWDLIFTNLYVIFFAGGYLLAISQVASLFNLSELAEIIN